jgi:hypothetical protein
MKCEYCGTEFEKNNCYCPGCKRASSHMYRWHNDDSYPYHPDYCKKCGKKTVLKKELLNEFSEDSGKHEIRKTWFCPDYTGRFSGHTHKSYESNYFGE